MTHSELMAYANAFFATVKFFPAEIEALIAREEAGVPTALSAASRLRVQAYRNVLAAQKANSMAAIADVVVSP